MSRRIAAFVVLFAGFAIAASAQWRSIPPDAKRGTIEHVQDMTVAIDGVPKRLAPGAQIRGPSNLIVLPVSLPAGAPVRYLLDSDGMVQQVWLLTIEEAAEEAAQPDKVQ
jgi:hypothetical protein